MSQKALRVFLSFVLAFVYAVPVTALTTVKAYAADEPTASHGTIAITSADATNDVITIAVGETATVAVTPYQHVQYKGCGKTALCPGTCSEQPIDGDCFIANKGCCCDSTPALRTASVTATIADGSVATASEVVASSTLASSEVGTTNSGTITVTGVKEGTTTITVAGDAAAANDTTGKADDVLQFWNSASKTYTVNVVDSSASDEQPSIEGLESEHDYASSTDDTKTYTWAAAATYGMAVTFDEQTMTEATYDFIYVMDGNDAVIGKFTGAELAGKTVYVPQTDTVKIRLTSDNSGNKWGYKVTSITAMTSNDLSLCASIAAINSQSCSEGPATPDPVVTYGAKTLVKGTDYTVTYANNEAAGKGTVTVTGTGDYTGTVSADFRVYAAAVAENNYTGYSIRCYNTQAAGMAMNNGQRVEYTINFDGALTIDDADALASALVLDSRLTGYTASIGADGSSLILDCVLGFALTDGRFWLKSTFENGEISGLTVTKDGVAGPAYLEGGIYALINSTLAIEVVEQVRGTATTPASTTYKISNPSPVRGMHHMAWTSNGTSILSGTAGYGQTTTAHQHMFFSMDPASTIVSNAKTALAAAGYTITLNEPEGGYTRNPDNLSTFTVTADTCNIGEIIDAYVYDDAFLQKYDMTLDSAITGLPYTPDPTQPSIEGLESDHNYANNADETKTYTWAGNAYGFAVTFDANTSTENNWDYIYIMDGDDNVIGTYTGTALAGATVYVPQTDTVKIRLTSDGSGVKWGYKVTNITALSGNDLAKSGAIDTIVPQFLPTGEDAACTPEPVVTYGAKTLVKDTDYTVAYAKNTELGTATVTVTGIGDYKGSVTKEFSIVNDENLLDPATVTANQKNLLRQAGDTGSTTVKFTGVDDTWMNSVTKVSVAPVDNGVAGEAVELTADQYKVTSTGITFTRTEAAPIFNIITGENPIEIKGRWSTNVYPQSRVYQVTVEATGYNNSVGTATFYTGTAAAFSIIIDADGDSATTDDQTVAKSWTAAELAALEQFGYANGSSQCGMTGFRTFSGYGVTVEDLLLLAGVSVSETDSFLIDTSDHYGNKQTYQSLFGATRYFLQSVYDDQEVKDTYARLVQEDDEAGAMVELRRLLAAKAVEDNSTVKPMISTGYVETLISGDQVASATLPTAETTKVNTLVGLENQFRFIYGIELVQEDVTVTFDTQGGSEVATQTVKSHLMTSTANTTMYSSYWASSLVIYRGAGKAVTPSTATDTIAVPENPTREGYTFLGWYTDADCTEGNEFDFTANDGTVDAATTLYAKWAEGITLTPSVENAMVGETFTVDIVANVESLAALDKTTVTYDDKALRLVSIEKGAGLSESTKFTIDGNDFSFFANTATASDGLVVATLTFEALAASDSAAISIGETVIGGMEAVATDVVLSVAPFAGIAISEPGTLGDANNNGKINIVDAQVIYDLGCNKYGSDWADVVALFGTGATKASVTSVVDVNKDKAVDAADALAVQSYVHTGKFGA